MVTVGHDQEHMAGIASVSEYPGSFVNLIANLSGKQSAPQYRLNG
jgi:hypothetical protein